MATRAANVQAIETALGEPWSTIRARLEAAGGASASHKELAEALGPQFDGIVDRHEGWVQGAVVAYEQEIGRRVPGQRADGTFDVAVSRTLTGDRDEVIAGFAELIDDRPPQGLSPDAGVELTDRPRRSRTQKRSFWRAGLEDGTRFEAAAEAKPADRTLLVLTVSRLPDAAAVEEWRAHLKDLIGQVSPIDSDRPA